MNQFNNELITELPKVEELTFKNIQQRYLYVLLINWGIALIIGLLIVFGVSFIEFENSKISDNIGLLYIGLCIIFIVRLLYVFISFPKRKYAIRDRDVNYQSGVLFHKLTTVPLIRVQHVEISQSFIAKQFNLASLQVYTAGDDATDLEINGLSKVEAHQIREHVLTTLKTL